MVLIRKQAMKSAVGTAASISTFVPSVVAVPCSKPAVRRNVPPSSPDDLPETLHALAASFGAGDTSAASGDSLSMEHVRRFVAAHVARLLDENPGLLMSILYRIDVAEPKVRHVLECEPPPAIVDRLTTLIIERQLEKVKIRRRHQERESDRP